LVGVTARHRAIADELRDAILGEATLLGVELVSGAQLPSEVALAGRYGASRGTIREALGVLAAEGLLITKGRSGTFVRRLPTLVHDAHRENPTRQGTTDTWHSEVLELGHTPTQDFAFQIVAAEDSVARRLNIAPRELVVVRECTRYIDEFPWSEQVSYYPYEFARSCGLDTADDIPEGTVARMAAHGHAEVGWDDRVDTRPTHEQEQSLFRMAKGTWILVYRRVACTQDRIVRYTRELLPPDRNTIAYRSGDISVILRIQGMDGA
jgi:GntR family transcriptional regulator